MKLDENTTKIIIAIVPSVLIFIVDRLKNKNSSEGIYADHSQELVNTVEKLLKERQEWQDERIELKRQIDQLNTKIDVLIKKSEESNGEKNE